MLLQAALPCVGRLLLGHAITRLRITDEVPPRISVIDLAAAITTKDANQAAEQVAYVKKRHPEVTEIFGDFKFRGRGQKNTPVTGLRGAVELTFLLPGSRAARVRRQAAELLCRFLGGDIALVDEVCRNRGFLLRASCIAAFSLSHDVTSTMPLASVTHVSLCPLPLNLRWDQFGPTSGY